MNLTGEHACHFTGDILTICLFLSNGYLSIESQEVLLVFLETCMHGGFLKQLNYSNFRK